MTCASKREERDAIGRARIHVQRLKRGGRGGRAGGAGWRAVGLAELARARGSTTPRCGRRAAEEWDAIERPYQAALARWREAEAHVEAGDRAAARSPRARR